MSYYTVLSIQSDSMSTITRRLPDWWQLVTQYASAKGHSEAGVTDRARSYYDTNLIASHQHNTVSVCTTGYGQAHLVDTFDAGTLGYYGGDFSSLTLLKVMADKLGYRLVRKSKKELP